MPVEPPTETDIREDLEHTITNESNGDITGWFPESSVEASVSAFSGGLSLAYQYQVYTYLSNTLEYAGAAITPDDLRSLRIAPATVDVALINRLQSDADLDIRALDKGVRRAPGAYARGDLEIRFAATGATAPAGLEVTLQTAAGDGTTTTLTYVTTDIAECDRNAVVTTVPIRGVERGPAWNTGANTITGVPDSSGGIQSVTNPDPVTGGEPPESNDSLRERARGAELEYATLKDRVITALNASAGGGGVTEGDVLLQEFPTGAADPNAVHDYSYFNVIIDYNGPTDAASLVDHDGTPVSGGLQGLVDTERELGLAGYYVEPSEYSVAVTATVAPAEPTQTTSTAADINTARAAQNLTSLLSELGLGDDLYAGQIERVLLDADTDIAYAPALSIDVTAPDGTTTTTLARGGRQAIAANEKVTAGTVAVSAEANP